MSAAREGLSEVLRYVCTATTAANCARAKDAKAIAGSADSMVRPYRQPAGSRPTSGLCAGDLSSTTQIP